MVILGNLHFYTLECIYILKCIVRESTFICKYTYGKPIYRTEFFKENSCRILLQISLKDSGIPDNRYLWKALFLNHCCFWTGSIEGGEKDKTNLNLIKCMMLVHHKISFCYVKRNCVFPWYLSDRYVRNSFYYIQEREEIFIFQGWKIILNFIECLHYGVFVAFVLMLISIFGFTLLIIQLFDHMLHGYLFPVNTIITKQTYLMKLRKLITILFKEHRCLFSNIRRYQVIVFLIFYKTFFYTEQLR